MRLNEITLSQPQDRWVTYVSKSNKEAHDAWMDSEGFAPIDIIDRGHYLEYVWNNGVEWDYSIDGGADKSVVVESAPPGMEDTVLKLKKQYPGEEEKAFATAWSIYNKKKGKKPVDEGGMPASIIKQKQKYSMMTPKELYFMFIEISNRTGKTVQELAFNAARRHGYKNIAVYWNKIGGMD